MFGFALAMCIALCSIITIVLLFMFLPFRLASPGVILIVAAVAWSTNALAGISLLAGGVEVSLLLAYADTRYSAKQTEILAVKPEQSK